MIKPQQTVVFQGDSITDATRMAQPQPDAQENVGTGYVRFLKGLLPLEFPNSGWNIWNRGISGHKVTQLYARWQTDCLNLKPDVLSILVGVNDVWHGFKSQAVYNGVSLKHFIRTYNNLLDFTLEELPGCKILIGEPFLLKGSAWTDEFEAELKERRLALAAMCTERSLPLIPYQEAFDTALKDFTVADLAPDGVHPSELGHMLMAKTWLKTYRLYYHG